MENYTWHDLRKNSDDLPEAIGGECSEVVLTVIESKYTDRSCCYSYGKYMKLSDGNFYWLDSKYGWLEHPVYVDGKGGTLLFKVIAWRYIQKFDEELGV